VWERLQKTLTFVAYITDMITLLDGNPGRNRMAIQEGIEKLIASVVSLRV
jgi:hypothetical protein